MTTKRFVRRALVGVTAAFSAGLGACQSSTVDKFPDPGQVIVNVQDQNNTAVSGVTVDLLFPDNGSVWRSAITDVQGNASPGAGQGGILPGSYNVRVTPPANYHVNPAIPNSVPITVRSNERDSVAIRILTGPAGP